MCNDMMQPILLNASVLSGLDADAIGCEGRRITTYFMGLPWRFGRFATKDLPAPTVTDFLGYYPADHVGDLEEVKSEFGLDGTSDGGYVVLPRFAADGRWEEAVCQKM